ncbi:MAG: sigma-70 family RNA polymerase sigma factor, partial [Butyrivibrio sp.]|nr:sigma-70 family RNA polymerase sigma factor [Butyrivibrio sp.]
MLFLILSVLEDDQRKLVEDIFKNNYKKYLRISTRILGSNTVAEEAVSDALIKISLNIKRISHLPCPEMEAFCVTIVKNCAYDHLR